MVAGQRRVGLVVDQPRGEAERGRHGGRGRCGDDERDHRRDGERAAPHGATTARGFATTVPALSGSFVGASTDLDVHADPATAEPRATRRRARAQA